MTTRRVVETRRVPFRFDDGVDRHFAGGDVLLSHLLALFSASFPEGESFFVRSVRRYRDEITDPELRRQVAGFIGQEAVHGTQHHAFNERLTELGYPTRLVDRATGISVRLTERVQPDHWNLAVTAALEHVTATFAWLVLTDPDVPALFEDEEVRNLWLWHALEEIEHKAVAFDVFQQVSGDHRVRLRMWRMVIGSNLLTGVPMGLAVSLLGDPAARSLRNLRRSWRWLQTSPFARRALWDRLRDYERPDFHPDDHDTTALAEAWRERLFGDGAPLAERMASAG